jgi:hypothetical protein
MAKRTLSDAETKQTSSAPAPTATKVPALVFPHGNCTVLQFVEGAPADLLEPLIRESLVAASGRRGEGQVWIANFGHFFMREHAPVAIYSPDVPKQLIGTLLQALEMLAPIRRRRNPMRSLAFRGRTLVWLSDEFEKVYPINATL